MEAIITAASFLSTQKAKKCTDGPVLAQNMFKLPPDTQGLVLPMLSSDNHFCYQFSLLAHFPHPAPGKQLPWLWIGGSYKCRKLINYSGMLERYAEYTAGEWAAISPRHYYCFHKHCRNLDESNYSCRFLPLQTLLCFWGEQRDFLAHPSLYFTHSCSLYGWLAWYSFSFVWIW